MDEHEELSLEMVVNNTNYKYDDLTRMNGFKVVRIIHRTVEFIEKRNEAIEKQQSKQKT